MRTFDLPDGKTIDLDKITSIGALFVNKNDSNFNCYEIYFSNKDSIGILEKDLPRATFITNWGAV